MWLLALRNLKFIMMVNLNECKLGDKLKMRNGELAIYVGRVHVLRLIPWFAIALSFGMQCYVRMTMEL